MSRFSLPKRDREFPLSEEAADAAVMELLAYYEINIDELPGQEQRDAMESVASKLSRFYRMGMVENKREGGILKVTQHLANPPGEVKDLTYDRMSGAHKLVMDGFKDTERYAATQALMASLCGLPAAAIKKLVGNDLSLMECLSAVFRSG